MSTVLEKVDAANDAAEARAVKEKRWRPSGKKVYKPHMATKVRWGVEDSMKRLLAAEEKMERVLAWLNETTETYAANIDDHGRAHLGKLERELFGLALDVSKAKEYMAAILAESKRAK
jgi:hypothetical protein